MSLTKKTKDRSSADYWREAADATAAAATAAAATAADSTAVDAAAVMDALEPADAAAEAV
jgi:hypothetical protein